jgi:aryl-alcohol dehydrogenase-like predicted oxidoreductase
MTLASYRTLGRSGLVVSPLALGTMTFGTARWGLDEAGSSAVFDAYVEAGGNLIDTADVYAGGRSEEMVGNFIAERKLRDRIIVATKAGFSSGQGVHTGGNGAKHLHTALEGSLKRLRTDYIDLFWIHVWDSVTPAEELLETMTALARAGKARYWGMSNAPAWYVSKIATLAAVRGVSGPIALQYFYSLVNRDIEDEHIPLAREFGMGVVPWSPLAYGLLTGKYDRAVVEAAPSRAAGLPRDASTGESKRPEGDKRLDGANPFGDSLFTPRNWKIVDELKRISAETGETPARIAGLLRRSWESAGPSRSWTMQPPWTSCFQQTIVRPSTP